MHAYETAGLRFVAARRAGFASEVDMFAKHTSNAPWFRAPTAKQDETWSAHPSQLGESLGCQFGCQAGRSLLSEHSSLRTAAEFSRVSQINSLSLAEAIRILLPFSYGRALTN